MSVVITGVGAITPLGMDLPSSWEALIDGQNGIHPIKRFDATGFPVQFGAECPNVEVQSDLVSLLSNSLKQQFCYTAAAEAINMAKVDLSGPRVGISIGSEAARPDLFDLAHRLKKKLPIRKEDLQLMDPQAPLHILQHLTKASGPTSVISTACTSSSQAIGEGLLRLRRGEVDKMIVGGVDVLVDPIMVTGFSLLGALSTRNEDPLFRHC